MARPTRFARLAAFAGAGATFLLSGAVLAGPAAAQYPEIEATWACDGTVASTARSRAGTTPGSKTNPTIDVAWTGDRAADFRRIPADAFVDLPSGRFGADNGFELSGSFVPAPAAGSVGVLVTEAADWADGTPRRGPGQEDDSQFVRLARPIDCPPPVEACVEGTPSLEAVNLTAVGGTATADFAVAGCGEVGLALPSASSGAPFDAEPAGFSAGPGSLSVALAPCASEVELGSGGALLADTTAGPPCPPPLPPETPEAVPPTAAIADPTCVDGGAVVTLTNPGTAPVAFTVAGADHAVAAGATQHVVVPVATTPSEIRVTAPGMADVVRTFAQDCTVAPARPSALVGDATCLEQGVLVELANAGAVPVTFTIAGPDGAVTRTVPAGGEGSEVVRLPAGGGRVVVTAPGMDDVVRSLQLECAAAVPEVASEVEERPADVTASPRAVAAPARSPAAPTPVAAAAPAAQLPRTGADGTATLLRLSFTLLLLGLVLTGAPVVGRRRAAGRSAL